MISESNTMHKKIMHKKISYKLLDSGKRTMTYTQAMPVKMRGKDTLCSYG